MTAGTYTLIPFTTGCRLKARKQESSKEAKLVTTDKTGKITLTSKFRWELRFFFHLDFIALRMKEERLIIIVIIIIMIVFIYRNSKLLRVTHCGVKWYSQNCNFFFSFFFLIESDWIRTQQNKYKFNNKKSAKIFKILILRQGKKKK